MIYLRFFQFRYRIVFIIPGILLLLLILTGCERGAKYTIMFKNPKGIVKKDPIIFKNITIGKVKSVYVEAPESIKVDIIIEKRFKSYVQDVSKFVIIPKKDSQTGQSYIKMFNIADEGKELLPNTVIVGSENMSEVMIDSISKNWKKDFVIVLTGILLMIGMNMIFKFVVKKAALAISMIAGLFGAGLLKEPGAALFTRFLPTDYRPDLVAFVSLWLVFYLITVLLIAALFKPLRKIG